MPTQVCNQCSNVNPGDASYCYYDGVRLAGGAGGPVNAATQNFATPFVFPSGQQCKNFDQFATTCQSNWKAASDLLKGGMFSGFFGGMGRSDLAMAAQEAARFPDLDRGLDQFLAKLPTQTLQPPKLKVEPTDINLGQMSYGQDRIIELHLANAGMRLLYGSVASDNKWLMLGDGTSQQKLFQFGSEQVIQLHIKGKELRASPKPLEAQLLVESSGGNATVTVHVTVPVVPFNQGPLAGSKSPREIAEKARGNAAEAAPYFEKGAIADWFKTNGWIYPVQGPSAIGLGAVQQFFEALGLAKAPKVEIDTRSLALSGAPGQAVSATLDISTQEKKPVYAHAMCEQPWVDVKKVKLAGRMATINVVVPSIPNRPGETLQANIHVSGNGNQRFTVPLSLTVTGSASAAPAAAPNPFAFSPGPAPAPARTSPDAPPPGPAPSKDAVAERRKWMLIHGIPLGVILIALLILLIRDFMRPKGGFGSGTRIDETPVEDKPKIALLFDSKKLEKEMNAYVNKLDGDERTAMEQIQKAPHNNMNFGVFVPTTGESSKKLFYGWRGQTNNTLLKIGGDTYTFGKSDDEGGWESEPEFIHWNSKTSNMPSWVQKGAKCTWKVKGIYVTQDVQVIGGESIEVSPNVFKRYYDTCNVVYKIENKSSGPKEFGMRILLDTLIGDNDGVPFSIPGQQKLEYFKSFEGKEIPDFVTALERESLDNPGVVVQLNLRNGGLEPPRELRLTKWPGAAFIGASIKDQIKAMEKWDVPLKDPKGSRPDSAVALYWSIKELPVGGKPRTLGYSYALSSISGSKGKQLAISVGGIPVVGQEITVMAQVNNAQPGETVTIDLPTNVKLKSGSSRTQDVPPPKDGRPTPVTWRLECTGKGPTIIRVKTHSGAEQAKKIVIDDETIY